MRIIKNKNPPDKIVENVPECFESVSPAISLIQSITESKTFMTDASLVLKTTDKLSCAALSKPDANVKPIYSSIS